LEKIKSSFLFKELYTDVFLIILEVPCEITPVVPIKPLSRRRFLAALAGSGTLALLGGLTLRDAWPFLVSQWTTQPLGIKPSRYAAWTRDLARLAITPEDDMSKILLWDYLAQRIVGTFHSPVSGQSLSTDLALDWSPDGRRVLQVTNDSSQANVMCWDVATQKTVYAATNPHISDVWLVFWSPDGRLAAVIGNATFVVLNSDNGQARFVQQLSKNDTPIAIAWSPTGERLAFLLANTTTNAITLCIWDVATNTVIAHLKQANVQYNSYDGWTAALAWVPGKNELVMVADKTLQVVSTENHAFILEHFTDFMNDYTLAFAPDGNSLAVVTIQKGGFQVAKENPM
jgi:WD40 repeat protein